MLSRKVWLLWILFLARAAFLCTMLPLWEGWDEYAHFAWLDHWVAHGTLPRFDDRMASEVSQSLELTPLAGELRWMPLPALTHRDWWQLPEQERMARRQKLRELPATLNPGANKDQFYEAQQPPLYYWIFSLPLRLVESWPLASRVLLLRLVSALLASAAIPLTWLTARRINGEPTATLAAAILAIAPGFLIDVSRVANDALAIALFALTLWLLSRTHTTWQQLGASMGAALLAKAYLLVLIPIVCIVWFRRRKDLCLALMLAIAISGWWYLRNIAVGHALSGWGENPPLSKSLQGLFTIHWFSSFDIIAKSFVWFGAWSFLTLKSWMYAVIEILALCCTLSAKPRRLPLTALAVFLCAMVYGTLLYNAAHGVPNLPGWYLWPAGGAIAILIAGGYRPFVLTLLVALAAIDLYGAAALMLPWYAGFVPRNHAGLSVFFLALERLHTPLALALLWIAATLAIPVIAAFRTRAVSDAPR